MKTRFYEVHVFFSRQDGYSVAVKVESERPMSEEQIIDDAESLGLFTDGGDENHVDYVEEIDEVRYNLIKTYTR